MSKVLARKREAQKRFRERNPTYCVDHYHKTGKVRGLW